MTKILAIGGLGGSGTGMVAQLFINTGVYMGDELNLKNDNLIFTYLFKDPEWHKSASKHEIEERLNGFQQYMTEGRIPNANLKETINIAREIRKKKQKRDKLGICTKENIKSIWGWKEPNTQIYFENINNYFQNFRYIHVLRHGLDMAYSKNTNQVKNWGYKYGIRITGQETGPELAYKQLDYWICSNKDILKHTENADYRIYVLIHSELSKQPKTQIRKLFRFADVNLDSEMANSLTEIPDIAYSNGRYKKYDLGVFDKRQLMAVEELGFDV